MPGYQSGALINVTIRLSVSLSMLLAQKRGVLDLSLLHSTNRKPHAGSRTHRSSPDQKWPRRLWVRKIYFASIDISKTSEIEVRLLLNVNSKSRTSTCSGCQYFHRKRTKWLSARDDMSFYRHHGDTACFYIVTTTASFLKGGHDERSAGSLLSAKALLFWVQYTLGQWK